VLDEEPPAPAPTTTAAASVTVTTMRPDTTAVPVTTTVAAASDLAHTDGTPPWVLYGIAAGGALVLALVVLTMRRRRV
jgi:hypothetical protein